MKLYELISKLNELPKHYEYFKVKISCKDSNFKIQDVDTICLKDILNIKSIKVDTYDPVIYLVTE